MKQVFVRSAGVAFACQYEEWAHARRRCQSGPQYTIVDIDAGNVNKYGAVDEAYQLTQRRLVQSNAPVTIRVGAAVGALAKGGGSYAEVNFSEKAANGGELHYIYVPCLVVGQG